MSGLLLPPGLECAPLYFRVPERAATYGPEAADFGASAGLFLDPEQRLVVDAVYAVDAEDRLVSPVIGCAAPRQNVKTHVAKVCDLADLAVFRVPGAFHTAQQKDTALDAFRNDFGTGLADLFDNFDHLRRLVHVITDSDNDTSIVLKPKRAGDPYPSLTFATRTERGKVGFSGPRVTFDECPWLKPVHTAAMIPILSAQSMTGWVQVRYFGSPGHEHSVTWRDIRDRGRRGELGWIEWGTERVACASPDCSHLPRVAVGCALDREDLVRAANLSIGRRIDLKFVMVTERNEMPPAKYGRERLGWWDEPSELGTWDVVSEVLWTAARDDRSAPAAGVTLGVEQRFDLSGAAIALVGTREDGLRHVEIPGQMLAGEWLVDYRDGTEWLVERVAAIYASGVVAQVVVDAKSPGGADLIKALKVAEVKVVEPDVHDVVSAYTKWVEHCTRGQLRHRGQAELTSSVQAAVARHIGDRKAPDRRTDNAAPWVAASLALWGHLKVGGSAPCFAFA